MKGIEGIVVTQSEILDESLAHNGVVFLSFMPRIIDELPEKLVHEASWKALDYACSGW